ncbi:LysR family transcriptional regulator YbhD [Enhygromyxa salina]|uniref:LysR family transcriptional regulator YbhD n=1 Tax=Enhygromyxa salina TaxID=215803 RepID=A0A0C1ZPI9_9BACT|nr:LysR family transcriptional regulator [Enhygromyxa salina]KIG12943.1 LysR family transcriptional regulator YbhD [Enhygromyxa salina]
MSNAPDFEQLESFAVFAEHLNLTHAAKLLHLSQPALHTRLRRLGEAVGAPLYRREGRALVLTEAGLRTARFAREIRARLGDFTEQMRDEQLRAPVTLCAGEGALLYLLGPALRRFARRHPLRVLVRDAQGTAEAVAAGLAHLGVLSVESPPPGLKHELVAEVGFALALPSSDPLAERGRASWSDLAGRQLIVPPAGRPHRVAIDQHLPADAEIAVEISGWPLTLQLVALGIGVAIVNDFCRAPRGVALIPFGGLAPRRYMVVRDPRRDLDPRVTDLWVKLAG